MRSRPRRGGLSTRRRRRRSGNDSGDSCYCPITHLTISSRHRTTAHARVTCKAVAAAVAAAATAAAVAAASAVVVTSVKCLSERCKQSCVRALRSTARRRRRRRRRAGFPTWAAQSDRRRPAFAAAAAAAAVTQVDFIVHVACDGKSTPTAPPPPRSSCPM